MADVTSEEQVQEQILTYLSALPQPVVEQAVPDSQTVQRNSKGDVTPYFSIQFGDLQEGQTHSMIGPTGDDYIMPVYIQAVAPQARIARRMGNRIRRAMLSLSMEWTGEIRKRPGGGMFPLVSSNGATEAYMMPASFGVPIQYADLTTV